MSRDRYKWVVLQSLPGTMAEVRDKAGLGLPTIHRWMKVLRAEHKAHIGGWHRNEKGGPFSAVYHAGPGEDQPCTLEPIPQTEVCRRFRERARKDGRWEFRQARERAKYWANNPRQDPLVAALFGGATKGGV